MNGMVEHVDSLQRDKLRRKKYELEYNEKRCRTES